MTSIKIFDTTLRDGEQTPGVSLNKDDKLAIAAMLSDMGVNIIEAGFPRVSEGDFNAVKAMVESGFKSTICGFGRCVPEDIDACVDTGCSWMHIFIGTSPLHREFKLNMSKDEILKKAVDSITYAKERGLNVHFSPEDACRTEFDYLMEFCKAIEDAGAKIIDIPDTVGIMIPESMFRLISDIKKEIKVPLASHCHNDYGLAVANTVFAVKAGVEYPHTTINGLGERAGNADMAEVSMILERLEGIGTGINSRKLVEASRLVESLSGVRVMPNYPIVGENAFAHESGIHVHGLLKNTGTYEPFEPELVGARRRLVLGKHVGAHGVSAKLNELSIKASPEQLKEITKKVKELGDKRKKVTEEDLKAIAQGIIGMLPKEARAVDLTGLEIISKLGEPPVAKVTLVVHGKKKIAEAKGVGPVDASLNAIKKAAEEYADISLDEFRLDAITGGSDALAEVTVKLSEKGKPATFSHGVHEDINMAAAIAFVNGINRLLSK